MSFVPNQNKVQKHASRKGQQKKPDWDYTVNDLSEFRATPEEIAQRQESRRSKNLELVRKSAIEKRIARARRDVALTDRTNRPGTGNAFLKEILYSSADASQLLDDTQKALQVAQDLFAEDTKKYRAIPSVTAVQSDDDEAITISRPAAPDGLIKRKDDSQTKLDVLSDSVMKKTALNETFSASSSSSEDEAEGEDATPILNPPATRVDLQRFQRLLEKEEISTIVSEESAISVQREENSVKANQGSGTVTSETQTHSTDMPLVNHCDKENRPLKGSVSNTRKKKSSRKSLIEDVSAPDLSVLLEDLERRLDKYEEESCHPSDKMQTTGCASNQVSGYTQSLITCLHRMMSYFTQLQKEVTELKKQNSMKDHQLMDMANRTDLLTSELINTQEQFHMVLDELNRVKTDQRQELDELQAKVSRISKGQTVHTVTVDRVPQKDLSKDPQSTKTDKASHVTVRRSRSPVTIHPPHEQFDRVLTNLRSPTPNTTLLPATLRPEPTAAPSDPAQSVFTAVEESSEKVTGSSNTDLLVGDAGITHTDIATPTLDDKSLEQRINILKGDHQQTLERFKKLGLELQKGGISTPANWI